MNHVDEALRTAIRLEAMGITVRSAELLDRMKQREAFANGGGNRSMRRAAARARRRKGR